MKNVKLGLFSLMGIFGLASAFTNVPKHFNGTTYYAVSSGASFVWRQATDGLSCQPRNSTDFCTIVTKNGFIPTDGQYPTSTQATRLSSGAVYRPL